MQMSLSILRRNQRIQKNENVFRRLKIILKIKSDSEY